MKRLLLISNSTLHGSGYLDHCAEEIQDFLRDVKTVLFVPYALADLDGYAAAAKDRFTAMGLELESIHHKKSSRGAVTDAQAIFIGGGNTFRLLNRLYEEGLMEPIRERVQKSMPYIGSSAGSNMACPTIGTTNDMPIVFPPSFEALGLIPFQLNCHFLDADPDSTHKGETREQRLKEYHEVNDLPVVGLREGAMLRVEGKNVALKGKSGAKLFQKDEKAAEHQPGDSLDFLLG